MLDSVIIWVILGGVFVLFFAILQRLNLRNSIKITLLVGFLLLCVVCSVHVYRQSVLHSYIQEYEKAFEDKNILICDNDGDEVQVDKKNFIYFPDILLFMGKNEHKGINIKIENCTRYIDAKELEAIHD